MVEMQGRHLVKKGDLVEFYTSAWVFEGAKENYKNPGIILSVSKTLGGVQKLSAEVYWADGKVTKEYDCYLRPACTTKK